MNQLISKIALLQVGIKKGPSGRPLISRNAGGDFFPIILKLMNPIQKKFAHRPVGPSTSELCKREGRHPYFQGLRQAILAAGKPVKREGRHPYFQGLRQAILAAGKPVNKVFFKRGDLPLLKRFLCQCGFSQEKAKRILREMAENSPGGEINLSQFFSKVDALEPANGHADDTVVLEASAIPYIESVLRDIGMTPKEVDRLLGSARSGEGGLKLNNLIRELKKFRSQLRAGDRTAIDQNSAQRVSHGLSGPGIALSQKKDDGEISINDLIAALERMTGKQDKGNKLPPEVKKTIAEVLQRAVSSKEKSGPISSDSPLEVKSQPQLSGLISKGELRGDGEYVREKNRLFSLKKNEGVNARKGEQKGALYTAREAEKMSASNEGKESGPLHAGKKAGPFSRLDTPQVPTERGGEKGDKVVLGKRIFEVNRNVDSPGVTAEVNWPGEIRSNAKVILPAYLVDQVGRQLSRSILKGERVFKLHLKPPELGAVRIEMDMKDGALKLGMTTENNSVRELLVSHVHELRDALLEQGVRLEKVEIEINYAFAQSRENGGRRLKQGETSFQDKIVGPFAEDDDGDDLLEISRRMATGDYLLDLVA